MKKLPSWMLAGLVGGLSANAWAQIPVDLTRSTFTTVSATKFQVDNLNVPNVGNFQLSFEWNPATAQFAPVIATLRPNGDVCTTAVLKGNTSVTANLAGYRYMTRVNANGEFGGIQIGTYPASELTIAWAKTATQDANPYLVGRLLTSFDASKGYGVIGEASTSYYVGFAPGDFVEVTGSPDRGAVSILKIGTAASISMPLALSSDYGGGQVLTTTNNCPPASGGLATGNLTSQDNDDYVYSALGVNAGSIAAASNRSYAFTTNWGNFSAPATFRKAAVGYGVMGTSSSSFYSKFTPNQTIFGVDIGTGVAIGGVDSTGKVIAATVFVRPQ